jgi:hypothetical protein
MPRDCTGALIKFHPDVQSVPSDVSPTARKINKILQIYKNMSRNISLPPQISSRMSKDGQDWLVSAIDPYHDFERSIEGAPDHLVSKSFTRRFNQALTIGANADDDYIYIDFFGFHGVAANWCQWGVDSVPVAIDAGVSIHPIHIYRSAVASGTIGQIIGATATTLGGFDTTQSPDVPSRIVSMGLEITDVTPSLYKKGTIYCTHVNGEVEDCNYQVTTPADGWFAAPYFTKPCLPSSTDQIAQLPGAYVGKLADGIYTQARLCEFQPPRRQHITHSAGGTAGSHNKSQVIMYAHTTASRSSIWQPTVDPTLALTPANMMSRTAAPDSGFQPFRIICAGMAAETTLQVTVKITVEYFPVPTHLFECGLATFSPAYDPLAIAAYHAIISQLPYAVPVGFNSAGEFWRMAQAAARRVASVVTRYGPAVLDIASKTAAAAGQPEVAAMLGIANKLIANKQKQPPRRLPPIKRK